MKIIPTPFTGLHIAESNYSADHRGSFGRFYCERELESVIGSRHIVQINHSVTSKVGAVRGMHYQRPPHAEMKIVRCLKGRVWDAVIDLRRKSQTFLHWHSVELSPNNRFMMIIPEGFAHGFQALEENSEILYLHTAFYQQASEGGVSPQDPRIGIKWPLPIKDLSTRDQGHPLIMNTFEGIEL